MCTLGRTAQDLEAEHVRTHTCRRLKKLVGEPVVCQAELHSKRMSPRAGHLRERNHAVRPEHLETHAVEHPEADLRAASLHVSTAQLLASSCFRLLRWLRLVLDRLYVHLSNSQLNMLSQPSSRKTPRGATRPRRHSLKHTTLEPYTPHLSLGQ